MMDSPSSVLNSPNDQALQVGTGERWRDRLVRHSGGWRTHLLVSSPNLLCQLSTGSRTL